MCPGKKGFKIKDYGFAASLTFFPLKVHDTALMVPWQIVLGNIRFKIKYYSSVQICLKIQDCSYVVLSKKKKKSSERPWKIILGTASYEIKDYSSVKLCLECQDCSYDVLLKKSLKHLDDPFPLVPLKIIQSRIAQEGLKSRLTAMMSFRK